MSTPNEEFWNYSSYAFVGHSAKKPFPKLSYRELRKQGRKVFPVDPSVGKIEGDATFPDLSSLPEAVDAVVLESPREETADWVRAAADAGIENLWIHANRDTPEALEVARERGLRVRTGSCAVMYVKPGLSYHSIHKWIDQALGKY
ncbi:MAG: CoA-binding protein [Myxococcota bacterium]|nr:CoA-binding protein [Myxococcota bacterium]